MPHIILECSDNLIEQNLSPLLLYIHHLLVTMLPTQLSACQSGISRYSDYFIADGNPRGAFVHLSIRILTGRSDELLSQITQKLTELLKAALQQSLSQLTLQISVAINDLPKNYHR